MGREYHYLFGCWKLYQVWCLYILAGSVWYLNETIDPPTFASLLWPQNPHRPGYRLYCDWSTSRKLSGSEYLYSMLFIVKPLPHFWLLPLHLIWMSFCESLLINQKPTLHFQFPNASPALPSHRPTIIIPIREQILTGPQWR